MSDARTSLNRRTFLQSALGAGAGIALAGPFAALGTRVAGAAGGATGAGYGPLAPVKDQTTGLELLMLPRGFEYVSFGWRNDVMSDGTPTPSNHDGMAAFRDGDVELRQQRPPTRRVVTHRRHPVLPHPAAVDTASR